MDYTYGAMYRRESQMFIVDVIPARE